MTQPAPTILAANLEDIARMFELFAFRAESRFYNGMTTKVRSENQTRAAVWREAAEVLRKIKLTEPQP